ncbi:flagellar export protein FliJ [Nitrosomonas sp.]|uniref:flagellar export protein FliJ n=1 Tax=Nitrosomonas sp. TaxID=42353 RepID=UPI0025CBABD3|nr:flagellar export protein FliJ [Nitrosomonas sp.]MCC6916480.1 flagellar export protein FliJ [Nitrosomonas sp.]
MATPRSLKLLLDHAHRQTDDAAINLGKLNLKQQEAEKTLQLLVEYRENYQTQFLESAGNGISPVEWRNFKAFISKLDTAIHAQQKLVAMTQQHTEAGNMQYHAHRKKLKSYDTLSQRAKLRHQSCLQKQEQGRLDEHTAHAFSKQQRNEN